MWLAFVSFNHMPTQFLALIVAHNIHLKGPQTKANLETNYGIFEMAAMPFPCNGLMLCCVNIPQCFSMNLLVVLSLISINFFYWGWPIFGFKQFLMVDSYLISY